MITSHSLLGAMTSESRYGVAIRIPGALYDELLSDAEESSEDED